MNSIRAYLAELTLCIDRKEMKKGKIIIILLQILLYCPQPAQFSPSYHAIHNKSSQGKLGDKELHPFRIETNDTAMWPILEDYIGQYIQMI